MIKLFVAFDPPRTTDQQHRYAAINGKVIAYKGKRVEKARKTIKNAFSRYAPKEPMTGALKVTTVWCFPYKKTEKRSLIEQGAWIPKTTRPDGGNLQKALDDVLTELGYWTDDAIITDERVLKGWYQTPGIYLCIEEAEDTQNTKSTIEEVITVEGL